MPGDALTPDGLPSFEQLKRELEETLAESRRLAEKTRALAREHAALGLSLFPGSAILKGLRASSARQSDEALYSWSIETPQ